MPKKILIIFRKKRQKEDPLNSRRLVFSLLKKETGAKVIFTSLDELDFYLAPNKSEIIFEEKYNILDFDLIFFVALKEYDWLYRCIIKLYPNLPNLQNFNIGIIKNKLFQYICFYRAKLLFPKTFYTTFDPMKKINLIEQKIDYPIVMKSTSKAKGFNMFLAVNRQDLKKLIKKYFDPEEKYIFQEFIPNKSDMRIIVINDAVKAVIKRTRTDPQAWQNNVSLGAKRTVLSIKKVPDKWKKLAIEAKKAIGYTIGGVDIVESTRDKKLYLWEINFAPDPNPGTDRALINFIKKKLKNK